MPATNLKEHALLLLLESVKKTGNAARATNYGTKVWRTYATSVFAPTTRTLFWGLFRKGQILINAQKSSNPLFRLRMSLFYNTVICLRVQKCSAVKNCSEPLLIAFINIFSLTSSYYLSCLIIIASFSPSVRLILIYQELIRDSNKLFWELLRTARRSQAHSPLPVDRINFEHNLSFPLSDFTRQQCPALGVWS